MDSLAIYLRLARYRLRAEAQYRASLFLNIIGSVALWFLDLLTILVIFHRVPTLGDWSFAEVAFLFGASYFSFSLSELFIDGVETVNRYVLEGRFDSLLLRPVGTLAQIAAGEFRFHRAPRFLMGALVLAFASSKLAIVWTPLKVAAMINMLACGVVIFGAVWVGTNTISFFVPGARETANAFTYGGREVTMFPLEVFGRWLRRIITLIVPLGFVAYYPSLYILGRPVPTPWISFTNVPAAALAVLAASWMWRYAVRHYRSTGS